MNNSLISNYQTKLLILDAADKLVEETPFDKLSVTQICEEAGISRATFYRCFKDKFAIAQWHVELAWAQGANEIGRTLSWKEGYYITEANIASRNLFYAGVAKSNDYNAIDNFAPRLRRKTITETLTQMRKVPMTERLKFQIDATVELEVHLLPKWHYGFYDVPLDEMCEWVADSVPRELFDLLNTPLHPRFAGTIPEFSAAACRSSRTLSHRPHSACGRRCTIQRASPSRRMKAARTFRSVCRRNSAA